jgi:hypothetical protein
MLRRVGLAALSIVVFATGAQGQFIAQQITVGTAVTLLFGGSDADGGIDDWYVSNGVVQAIVDDVGAPSDLAALLGPNAPPKQSEAAFTGGSVIDLGLVGANNDQLVQLFTVGGLSTSNFILYDNITAFTTPTSATIRATGRLLGFNTGGSPVPPENLVVVTDYTAAGSDPFLTITTTVTNTHPTNAAFGLGGFLDAILWTLRGIVPFSPVPGRGFRHAILDLSNPGAAVELPPFAGAPGNISPADGVLDPPSGTTADEVAYGLLGVSASIDQGSGPTITPVNTLFGVSGTLVTALGNLPVAGLVNPGGQLTYIRRIYVGSRNDVAAVSNAIVPELGTRVGFATGTISGNVDAEDTADVAASVIATRTGGTSIASFPNGTPLTHFRTDPSGSFSGIVLPEGIYDLEFRAVERPAVTVSGVVVSPSTDTPVAVPPLAPVGILNITIFERAAGPDPIVPGKVTFTGIKGTSDPLLRRDFDAFGIPSAGPDVDLMPETFAGGPGQRNFLYLGTGSGSVQLRPGRYEMIATRGPEYTARRRRIRVRPGKTKDVKMHLRRVVDTPGFMSGDFHIHSARSLDSSAPLRDRVASFAGEGVEVMISTDHDYHVDYNPIIAGLGIGDHITSIVGNEVTTSVPNPPAFPDAIGHINAWPLPVDPDARRDGSIEDEFVAPNFLYSRLRDQGAEVVQYNHVRAGVSGLTSIGFFNNFGYDPDLPITTSPNDLLLDDDITGTSGVPNPDGFRNIDFDVMEIANGLDLPGYIASRRDWLSLLNQRSASTPSGPVPFIAGTGVSDSHRITLESAGYFRTYVGGVGDDPALLSVPVFNHNVRIGNMMATSGPYVEFSVSDSVGQSSAGLGRTLVPATNTVLLNIRVQSTNWLPVEEVRVIVNGFVSPSLTFDGTTTPAVRPGPPREFAQNKRDIVRFEASVPVTLSVDSYFIVEAGAKLSPLPAPPELADQVVPGLVPLAFTNPIFVDLAGNGFDPPGLPVMAAAPASETLPAFARVERADQSYFARWRDWGTNLLASLWSGATAEAEDEEQVLTGRALQAKVEKDKDRATVDYFPLYRFRIPESAVEEAIDRLPEPERSRIRAIRSGGK